MQPTNQNVVPVSLFEGTVDADASTTVDLDSAYDHVIECVTGVPTGATAGEITVKDSEGNYVFGGEVAATGTAFTGLEIVLQSETSITITAASTQSIKISGSRLAPSAAILFAS